MKVNNIQTTTMTYTAIIRNSHYAKYSLQSIFCNRLYNSILHQYTKTIQPIIYNTFKQPTHYHTTTYTLNDNEKHKPRQGLIDDIISFNTSNHTATIPITITQKHNTNNISLETVSNNKLVMVVPLNTNNNDIAVKLSDVFKVHKTDVNITDESNNDNKTAHIKLPSNMDKDGVADRLAQSFGTFPKFL